MAEKSKMDKAFEKRDIFMIMEPEDIDRYLINKYKYYPATDTEFDGIGYYKFVMFNDTTTMDDLTVAMNDAAKFSKGFGIGIDVVINVEHPVYESHKDMIDTFVADYNLFDPYFIEHRGRPQKKWKRDAITEAQAMQMVDVCCETPRNAERKQFMVVGLYYTGMRIGEFIAMRPHWIEMYDGIMVINIPREEGSFRTKTPAGERPIYITEEIAIDAIQSWFKTNELFGKSDVTAWEWCVELGKRAGIDKRVTPHILRHSCISRWSWEGKMTPETIKKMAGHADFVITSNTYIHQFKGQIPPDILKLTNKNEGEQE